MKKLIIVTMALALATPASAHGWGGGWGGGWHGGGWGGGWHGGGFFPFFPIPVPIPVPYYAPPPPPPYYGPPMHPPVYKDSMPVTPPPGADWRYKPNNPPPAEYVQ